MLDVEALMQSQLCLLLFHAPMINTHETPSWTSFATPEKVPIHCAVSPSSVSLCLHLYLTLSLQTGIITETEDPLNVPCI